MTFCLSPREKWFLNLGRNNINDVLDKPQWNLVDNIVCLSLSRFEWADPLQIDIANYRTYPKSRGDNTSTHFNKHFFVKYQLYHTNFVKHLFCFFFLICLFVCFFFQFGSGFVSSHVIFWNLLSILEDCLRISIKKLSWIL